MKVMKKTKIKTLIISIVFSAMMLACSSTTRVFEYDKEGNVTKEIRTSESMVKAVTESTKNKTLIVWDGGWAGYVSVSPGTMEDPSPHCKMFAGKSDKGYIAVTDTAMVYSDSICIPDVIRAARAGSVWVTKKGIQGDVSEDGDK